MKMSWKPGT